MAQVAVFSDKYETHKYSVGRMYDSAPVGARKQYALKGCGQYSSGRYYDWPNTSFSVHYVGSRGKAELVLQIHFALHASHAALQILTSKLSPKFSPTNVFKK